MKLSESTEQDIEQLTEWIRHDPYHKDCLNPTWWLTGNGALSYCLMDSKGPTMYVRTEIDGWKLRLHTQFAPLSVVDKTRVMKAIIWAIPVMEKFAKDNGLSGLVYQSTSPSLISFMQIKFGFVLAGNSDFVMVFREVENVRPE
jgi:hypothetical protein